MQLHSQNGNEAHECRSMTRRLCEHVMLEREEFVSQFKLDTAALRAKRLETLSDRSLRMRPIVSSNASHLMLLDIAPTVRIMISTSANQSIQSIRIHTAAVSVSGAARPASITLLGRMQCGIRTSIETIAFQSGLLLPISMQSLKSAAIWLFVQYQIGVRKTISLHLIKSTLAVILTTYLMANKCFESWCNQ